jgi:methylene-tetrahydromethanopterin dehydrogenase
VKRTGIFIGGREFGLALDMLQRAKAAMVPPFQVSVFADPSGAITTAAALVACVESCLQRSGAALAGKKVCILGGTGPVGICAGILAAGCGAESFIASHRGLPVAREVANEYNGRFGVRMHGLGSGSDAELAELLHDCQVLIGCARAGIRVVSQQQLASAAELLVAADVNAVPPAGLDGVGVHDLGRRLEFTPRKALAVGALAIGNVKYKVHLHMFELMQHAAQPQFLDHERAFAAARDIAAGREPKI